MRIAMRIGAGRRHVHGFADRRGCRRRAATVEEHMTLDRRTLGLAALAAPAILALPASARAQAAWPDRPVRVIVPWPPGGSTDAMARLLQQRLSERLGQTIVIENRGGASGAIGAGQAAQAAPDGYTWLLAFDTQGVNASLMRLPFDTVTDFAPVSLMARGPMFLVTHRDKPFRTVADWLAAARRAPETVTYATSGSGTLAHLAMTLLSTAGNFKVTHVPYRGGGPATTAMLGGEIDSYMTNAVVVMPHIRAGNLRPLAVTSAERWPGLPDIPTFAEAGLTGAEAYTWWAWFGRTGTPAPIVERMGEALRATLREPAITARIEELGANVVASSPAELTSFLRAEIDKWGKVIRDNNIRAES
jgi:tripartite-type tricarboxylate transporter receptor subunit TctC